MKIKERIRFWYYWNRGYVRITINKGQTIKFSQYHLTDEGYHCEGALFRFDGRTLEQEVGGSSRDCDGPYSSGYTLICDVDEIAAISAGEPNIRRPDWKEVNSFQRDYYAEAMGY